MVKRGLFIAIAVLQQYLFLVHVPAKWRSCLLFENQKKKRKIIWNLNQ